MSSYKALKEAFVSDTSGSTITHVNLISLAALLSVTLYSALKTRAGIFRTLVNASSLIDFILQWALLVLPLLLSMTVFAKQPLYLNVTLFLPLLALLRMQAPRQGTMLPMASTLASSAKTQRAPSFAPLPALTTYRAHMMLMTVLAILAVDFPAFPRELAKCETFGVSLMDLGVGSFVFSQGVVSAIPILKNPYYINSPFLPKLWSTTKKSLPIIILGVIRVLLVKGIEYPEHVTEYGVHWNFFITLALLPIFQAILHPVLKNVSISTVGVILGTLQQILLSKSFLSYVIHEPRSASLFSKNKEGLVSLLGYLSIHILGLSTGILVLPPSPGFFRRRQKLLLDTSTKSTTPTNLPSLSSARQTDKTATELCAYSIMWWAAVGAVGWIDASGAVSRRLVNLRYILWIAAFNTSFLLSYLVVVDMWISKPSSVKIEKDSHDDPDSGAEESPADMDLTPAGRAEKVEKARIEIEKLRLKERESVRRRVKERERENSLAVDEHTASTHTPGAESKSSIHEVTSGNPPKLLDIINRHGLLVFLGANVLTGLVNLTIETMYVSDGWAIAVLSAYSLVVCGGGWVYDAYRRQ
ncbi:GWT1-domain-containing protein [Crepidotus variabilis]|uniref:GPI-anchored wall transfer protein n=1 Tax=Crepidotus variabilis TaxID=179855 RepID=A0A9P6ELY6_9AGAR|nr:GWT1-domain-containing protein [Crepidotus variabilis]